LSAIQLVRFLFSPPLFAVAVGGGRDDLGVGVGDDHVVLIVGAAHARRLDAPLDGKAHTGQDHGGGGRGGRGEGALQGPDHDGAVVEPVGGAAARAVGAGGHPDLLWTGPQAAG
jgi:hypothetical protein